MEFEESVRDDGRALLRRFEVPQAVVVAGWPEGTAVIPLPENGEEAVFQVASLSKTATALAVLMLGEQGRLRLDDPVTSHLVSWEPASGGLGPEGVTIRRLLSHTAGLPVGVPAAELDRPAAPDVPPPPLPEVLDGIHGHVAARIVTEPGGAFVYSNPGYGILELVIEDVTGQPYPDAMRALVFDPLGMSNSGFQEEPALLSRVAPGHRSAGRRADRYRQLPRSAGGLLSTGPDIAKMVRALVTPSSEGGLLSADSLAEMHTVPDAARGAFGLGDAGGYGLGLAAATLPSGRRFLANNGSHEGYNALYVAVPDQRSYLVVLTNAETGIGLELELALRWFDDVIGERPSIATTFSTVRRFVGLGTIMLILLAVVVLGRQVFQLSSGKRRWLGRPRLRRLTLRTLPAAAVASLLLIALNTGAFTSSIGGLPPARLISGNYDNQVALLAALLAALGALTTLAPPATSNQARSTQRLRQWAGVVRPTTR
ncbi:MAG TPA: serine hydrolase domain-containing protein [Acidimicrobiales bacterium]|nr:serine hydrolase domain-containing protein [Acidimicrobiales bacterium]